MLKKDMQNLIQAMEDQLLDYENTQRVDRDLIKSAADKERKHTKLRRHVDKALCAIEAIKTTSCRDEVEPCIRQSIYEDARNNDKPSPDFPPLSELYVSLNHLEEILSRPVEEPKQDSRFSQY
jgi:hypothetical protein